MIITFFLDITIFQQPRAVLHLVKLYFTVSEHFSVSPALAAPTSDHQQMLVSHGSHSLWDLPSRSARAWREGAFESNLVTLTGHVGEPCEPQGRWVCHSHQLCQSEVPKRQSSSQVCPSEMFNLAQIF